MSDCSHQHRNLLRSSKQARLASSARRLPNSQPAPKKPSFSLLRRSSLLQDQTERLAVLILAEITKEPCPRTLATSDCSSLSARRTPHRERNHVHRLYHHQDCCRVCAHNDDFVHWQDAVQPSTLDLRRTCAGSWVGHWAPRHGGCW